MWSYINSATVTENLVPCPYSQFSATVQIIRSPSNVPDIAGNEGASVEQEQASAEDRVREAVKMQDSGARVLPISLAVIEQELNDVYQVCCQCSIAMYPDMKQFLNLQV